MFEINRIYDAFSCCVIFVALRKCQLETSVIFSDASCRQLLYLLPVAADCKRLVHGVRSERRSTRLVIAVAHLVVHCLPVPVHFRPVALGRLLYLRECFASAMILLSSNMHSQSMHRIIGSCFAFSWTLYSPRCAIGSGCLTT